VINDVDTLVLAILGEVLDPADHELYFQAVRARILEFLETRVGKPTAGDGDCLENS
jgi:hypothetical protein